jgi:hypothetical protein
MGYLSCSITGAPVPVFPDGLEVACSHLTEGFHRSPLASCADAPLLFRIAFAFTALFYHKSLICQHFSKELARLFSLACFVYNWL